MWFVFGEEMEDYFGVGFVVLGYVEFFVECVKVVDFVVVG